MISFKSTTTPLAGNSIGRSPSRCGLFLIALVTAAFALSPAATAVTPPPDGGYPGDNTAEGDDALFSLTTGINNTALGFDALYSTTTGSENTATGSQALISNTTGIRNTANGYAALQQNTTGERNTATGRAALANNTTGIYNVATGHNALFFSTTGFQNTATGSFAGLFTTAGANNTADGYASLFFNTTGNNNTASGYWSVYRNTTGNNNTGAGYQALLNNTTGAGNIALGILAGSNLTTGDNNIAIGNPSVAGEAGTIRIGTQGTHSAVYMAGIVGKTSSKGNPVFVNADGQLGTVTSSARFKTDIKPMDKASEVLLALRPVTYQYKKELDPENTPQFGLVAEEVEKVNPALITRDAEGKAYTVRYEAINAMLLNEFLKEHHNVQELKSTLEATRTQLKAAVAKQESTIALQEREIKALSASLKEQASQIQKVGAQLELRKTAPRTVRNDR